jgi:crotonobetainyl-CoA:carnitine CoA-transferase CaiB-like acyl-CoA transferase
MTPRPLKGRKIVDLSQYIAGSSCAQLLADFGAEVVKVEPVTGDPSRRLGITEHGSVFFRQFNTGKSSIKLDLHTEPGREVLEGMLRDADAVVMNFAARTLRKLGLVWADLHARHPHLVVVQISAYGSDDPRTALDSVVQAVSGFALLNSDEHGRPRISAGYPTDVYSGLYGAFSAAMTILDPHRTEGLIVEVPMIEVAMSALGGPALLATATGEVPLTARGNRDVASAPSTVFACADGSIYIYAGLDKHWALLRDAIDGPTGTLAERLVDPERYEAAVQQWTQDRMIVEVLELTDRLGIPAAPVRRIEDALDDLHSYRPGGVVSLDRDGTPVPQFPVTFSGERIPRTTAPQEETS